jgi:5-methylcytosine-specific restriction endonuclease McrA
VGDGTIPAAFARIVRARAGYVCEYCRLPQTTQEAAFHVDHIRPRAAGGRTAIANLALACVGCSLRKGARLTGFDAVTGRSVALFNPRRDRWENHFE